MLYNEIGIDGTIGSYVNGDWKKIAIHDDNQISGFFGEYRYLSNFHKCDVWYEGLLYPSTECAYQASKVLPEHRKYFINISSAQSKVEWKHHPLVDSSAKEWDARKNLVMCSVVFQKFLQNEELRNKLLQTGNKRLAELNWWGDEWFGVNCRTKKGKNFLGKILEKTRTYFIDSDILTSQQMDKDSPFIL
jgi:ribA/ribD-fused uncharacterized protein